MKVSDLPSTLIANLGPRRLSSRLDRRRVTALLLEAVLYTAVAAILTRAWSEEAVIFSIFLTAGALVRRFNDLLDENRELVWNGKPEAKKEANVLTAVSLLVLFFGVFGVYFIFLQGIGIEAANAGFRIALDAATVDVTGSAAGAFLERNLLIMSSFFVLAFIYQAYGATLAIVWTACTWALVLTMQLHAQLERSDRPAWLAIALTIAAVLPHSILKALGYITGSLSAIFLSRGLMRYGLRDPNMRPVAGAVAVLALAAALCLVVAAFFEPTLARWLL